MSFPDRETVLDFISNNPSLTTKQEIARGLKVKGRERQALRAILKELEADGTLERTGKRAWAKADTPPPTGVVVFEEIDKDGDLIARAVGREGTFGPPIRYAGYQGKSRGPAPGVGDRGLAKVNESNGEYHAKLIKLFEQRDEDSPMTGRFERNPKGGRVIPASRKDKRTLLIDRSDSKGAEDGDLVTAIPKPGKPNGPAFGVVTEILGRMDDPRAASLLAIHGHDIPVEFPNDVLNEAESIKPLPTEREDLTHLDLITIDPADARDHDDAVYAEKLDDGWKVIVAIADVAAYVRPGTALDREAQKRGNSTYFPDRVVPMLPFELSADACSLVDNEDRPCMAVEMIFDQSGTKRSHRFIRGTMRSKAKLAYEDAQAAIDGKTGGPGEPWLEPVLKPLWGAYEALGKARAKRAPLDLDMPEKKVEIDEDGKVTAIVEKERFDAHRLIEEFMIQANVAAAETLEKLGAPMLYRVHDQPSDAKIAALADFLQTLDIKWALGERPQTHRFNKLLGETRDTDHSEAVSEIVLRSQAQAIYDPDNVGHFGLNLTRYAHFTSPIRRYSDLVIHRALISALKLGDDGLTKEMGAQLHDLASHLVDTERRSMAAEREATDRYLALYLQDRVGAEFEGRITGVTPAGLFIRMAGTGADGFSPISRLSDDYWVHNEQSMALIARGSGKRFELGQTVKVRLQEVTPLQGGLLLEVLSPPKPKKPGEKPPPSRGGRSGPRGKNRGKLSSKPRHKGKKKKGGKR
ncbi:ribonuclease R [Henriciella aquimarina]|uniref:ribonuclease R n=1 Tax=Henriciella aquimarina TaxID=545261 RepID=UPI0009FE905E|nr:ribonuclease R [Henriciella aquimarina]